MVDPMGSMAKRTHPGWQARSCTLLAGAIALLAALPARASAQGMVYPRRATQSHVRYDTFQWRYIDIWRGSDASGEPTWEAGPRRHAMAPAMSPATLSYGVQAPDWLWERTRTAALLGQRQDITGHGDDNRGARASGPQPATTDAVAQRPGASSTAARAAVQRRLGTHSGGVRLYFYERERAVAERAAAAIADTYVYLAESFEHVPDVTLPYFLYSTYHEFLQTNLFPVQEGVLGVTRTTTLELALPYFGDHRQFVDISTHEMAHQFTIHKVRAAARAMKVQGNALEQLPLWLIEGVAEYYAQRGLDPVSEVMVRDIVLNPELDTGYVLRSFFEERASVVWTYRLGLARCAFLESEYGPGTLQRILAATPRLLLDSDHAQHARDFPALLRALTGEDDARITQRFQSWLKRRAYPAFLRAEHAPETLDGLRHVVGRAQVMTSSDDGALLLYRSIDPASGRVELVLVDHRAPRSSRRVARDGVPGFESLHPVARRNFDLRGGALAFVARSRGRDVLYWQTLRHRARARTVRVSQEDPAAPLARPWDMDPRLRPWPPLRAAQPRAQPRTEVRWDVDIDLGRRRSYSFARHGLHAIEAVALAPDGERLALIAIDRSGQRDIYALARRERTLRRITADVFAERHLTWGPDGIVYTSDATGHGKYNLFLARDGQPGEISRLTFDDVDQAEPVTQADGRLFFVVHDDHGANVYERTQNGVVRRSDTATALYSPGPGPAGSLWALHYRAGRLRPVRLPRAAWLDQPVPAAADDARPDPPARMALAGAAPYRTWSLDNWTLGPVLALLGGSAQGLFGQGIALASDRLRNHTLVARILALGTWELIDTDVFYTNQERRTIWGAGLFQSVSLRYDTTFSDLGLSFTSAERMFGVGGVLRRPFNRFVYAQGALAVGGVRYFLLDRERALLADGAWNGTGRNLLGDWEAAHAGTALRLDGALSLGYNTLTYHPATGPISGRSALIEGRVVAQPATGERGGSVRLDAEQYIPLGGATNVMLRLGAGHELGDLMPGFFLSSYDTLRGVRFGDPTLLLGRSYFFATTELQFPLHWLVAVRFADLEGIVGADLGGVGRGPIGVWDRRVFNLVVGTNIGFGPLVLRLHFARPIDIGGEILPMEGDWNTSFSLGYRYQ